MKFTLNGNHARIKPFILPLAIVGLFALLFSQTAQAGAVTGFDAGRIMDDAIFTNENSMSVSQIQNFLNSKVPNCDTNGTQTSEYGGGTRAQYGRSRGYPPPYTCLKNYSQGGKSAARIIYDAAKANDVNPQVLIVLLQKEQGLVTDTWPWSIQYRSATGYGCPDTAACDSDYYGFTNQVNRAADMFQAIMTQRNGWYTPYRVGSNRIYWHPDTSRCGSSTVNILNRATVALYSYTPYRPNQSALNAGYGTGNSCSSYGNRNFYQYFKDWFGPPNVDRSKDRVLSGDWNGDGETDTGVRRSNVFYLDYDNDGTVDREFSFGKSSDFPLVGDWNGDGTDTIGVRREPNIFYLNNGFDGTPEVSFKYGSSGYFPLAGDWNGDGTDTIGVRRGDKTFLLNNSNDGSADIRFDYGSSGYFPLAGDWNGDGTDTIGVRRGDKTFLLNNSNDGSADIRFDYGSSGYFPLAGDWNGNNTDTIGVKRGGETFLLNNGHDSTSDMQFKYLY